MTRMRRKAAQRKRRYKHERTSQASNRIKASDQGAADAHRQSRVGYWSNKRVAVFHRKCGRR